jgi:hypothetical protein
VLRHGGVSIQLLFWAKKEGKKERASEFFSFFFLALDYSGLYPNYTTMY